MHKTLSITFSLQFRNFGDISLFGKDLMILLLLLNHLVRQKLKVENISINFTDNVNNLFLEQLDFKKSSM